MTQALAQLTATKDAEQAAAVSAARSAMQVLLDGANNERDQYLADYTKVIIIF